MQQAIGDLVVRQEGQFLEVTPAPEGLKQVLHSRAHVPYANPGGFLAVGTVPAQLYHERAGADGSVLDCLAGLLPVVLRFAAKAGYAARIQGRQAAVLPEPDGQSVERLGPLDGGFLRCVRQHDRALILYEPSAVDPAWLVAQVALAWPHRTLAVAVTRVEEARRLRDQVRPYLPGVVAVTSRNQVPDAAIGPVVIATYNGLGCTGIEVEKRDVVLTLHAVEASRPYALSCLGHAKRARVYGLLPIDIALAPFDQDVVRLLFGFEEVEVLRHGAPEVRVEVVWCRKVGCPAVPEVADLLEVKRQGIWRNHARNRQVARLARRLQAGEWPALGKDFPAGPGKPPGVAVLVENVEHAEALAPYLRGWALATHHGWRSRFVAKSFDETQGSVAPVTAYEQGVIATALGIEVVDWTGIEVLIRADGGVGLLPVPPSSLGQIVFRENNLPEPLQADARLLLVDIEDRHHPLLRRRSRQRQPAYAGRGWYAPGVDPVQARVEQFLTNRG
jgi:hypothetical protein